MKVQMVWLNNSQAILIRINENRKETPTIGGERERERRTCTYMHTQIVSLMGLPLVLAF
jgi:hypothetical protein